MYFVCAVDSDNCSNYDFYYDILCNPTATLYGYSTSWEALTSRGVRIHAGAVNSSTAIREADKIYCTIGCSQSVMSYSRDTFNFHICKTCTNITACCNIPYEVATVICIACKDIIAYINNGTCQAKAVSCFNPTICIYPII